MPQKSYVPKITEPITERMLTTACPGTGIKTLGNYSRERGLPHHRDAAVCLPVPAPAYIYNLKGDQQPKWGRWHQIAID